MIRDRLAVNVSLLDPKNGARLDGNGELAAYKGHRHPELPGDLNFRQSLAEDLREPLDKLLKSVAEMSDKIKDTKQGVK